MATEAQWRQCRVLVVGHRSDDTSPGATRDGTAARNRRSQIVSKPLKSSGRV